ncbi:MAG: hypothetical protein KJ970_12920 [Candidatus Eisenbacteria bacterium]|uniref:DUF1090 domain-containing protein n=1 Tax=Eiseniibacteriota bacterium TaxID=2212470 RepID=A0A948RXK3_UNCEI|nr:hypothetical protein [Candidatus Eisenbacteria bacterium]
MIRTAFICLLLAAFPQYALGEFAYCTAMDLEHCHKEGNERARRSETMLRRTELAIPSHVDELLVEVERRCVEVERRCGEIERRCGEIERRCGEIERRRVEDLYRQGIEAMKAGRSQNALHSWELAHAPQQLSRTREILGGGR